MGTVSVDRLTVKKGGRSWRALGSLARWQGALSCAQLSPDAKEPEELGAEGERWCGAPEAAVEVPRTPGRGRQAGLGLRRMTVWTLIGIEHLLCRVLSVNHVLCGPMRTSHLSVPSHLALLCPPERPEQERLNPLDRVMV